MLLTGQGLHAVPASYTASVHQHRASEAAGHRFHPHSTLVFRLTISCKRRASLALLAAPLLLALPAQAALPSFGKSPEAREKAQEDRKASLRAAAEESKKTGKAEPAFDDSQYAVSEDKSPNVHTVGWRYRQAHGWLSMPCQCLPALLSMQGLCCTLIPFTYVGIVTGS